MCASHEPIAPPDRPLRRIRLAQADEGVQLVGASGAAADPRATRRQSRIKETET